MQGGHRRQPQTEDLMEDDGGVSSLDLALVGRHALLFDDDAAAAFASSSESLLPWNGDDSLLMDRFDVRHLLQDLSGVRKRRPLPPLLDCTQEDLDLERYRDLEGIDQEENGPISSSPLEARSLEQGDYRSLPYSYSEEASGGEKVAESAIADFRPTFSVPGYLLTKLLHQIIAGTAKFVSGHGGQSEIILRVKQGHNPVFGFLNPTHHLHEYFRYLVEHPELAGVGKHPEESAKSTTKDASEGLSLLGMTYGDDEDEADLGTLISMEEDKLKFDFGKDSTNLKAEVGPTKVDLETEVIASVSGLQSGINASMENQTISDALGLSDEPPVAVKQAVQKIVEFIVRNGKDFEAVAKEKDKKYGRFQFLLPWNKYHSYYLKSLEAAQKSALSKQVGTVKDDTEDTSQECNSKKPGSSIAKPNGHVRHWLHGGPKSGVDVEEADDNSLVIRAPLSSFNQEKKKLKIVIGGKKEISSFGDGEDPAGMSADAAAAAVKLATSRYRSGLKPESSDHSLKTNSINGSNPGLSEDAATEAVMAAIRGLKRGKKRREDDDEEGRPDSVFVSVSGLHERVVKSLAESSERSIASGSYNLGSVPSVSIDEISLAKVAAHAATLAASCEADSADTQLTAEQKLKAERLRRAKMFTALIKGGGHNIVDSVSNRGGHLTSTVIVEGNIAETSNRDTDTVRNGEAHDTSSKEHRVATNGNNSHTSSKEYIDKHQRHRHEKRDSRHEHDKSKSGRSKRSHDSHRSKDVDEKDEKSHRRRKMDDHEKETEYSKRSHRKRGSPRDDYSSGKSHKHRESSSSKLQRLESKDVKDRSNHPRVESDTQKTKNVDIQELQITADTGTNTDADTNANANASSMSVEEIPDHLRAKIRAILFA